MGGVTQALAASVRAAGATIFKARPAVRVLLDGTRAVGVQLADGATITARVVVSNADPRRTMFELVGPEHLGASEAARLRELPRFAACPHDGAGRPTCTGLSRCSAPISMGSSSARGADPGRAATRAGA
jgi:phytoene dehydrogenase-like protein